jgi:hypothetical protein
MGKAFKPPRKTNDSQWRKVELLVSHDLRFGYCNCHRGTRKVKTLAAAKTLCGSRRSSRRNYATIEDVRAQQISRRRKWKAREYR